MATPSQSFNDPPPSPSRSPPFPPPFPPPLRPLKPRPQVFVSFRGGELRHGFVSHVVKALKAAGVNIFIDSHERKGTDVRHLFKRIKDSKMALVIFSDRYSESDWCLNELEKIDERVKEKKLTVIPVFYRISTDDVKNFKGKFGSYFQETVLRVDESKAESWKSSIKSITSKAGFTSNTHRVDSDLVDAIVGEMKNQLPEIPTEKKEMSIMEELLLTLSLAGLSSFIAPFVFNDTRFYQTRQWFVGVSFLVILRRNLF